MTKRTRADVEKTPRETEIDYLIENARSIIAPERAEDIARILTAEKPGQGKGLAHIGIHPREMKMYYRANYSDPNEIGVGVYELAIAIATALGETPPGRSWTDSPFHGQGRSAELWTRRAVAAIQRHYGLTPIAELN